MQMEPQEAVDKLRLTARVLTAFKSYYFDNKARTLEETPNNPWKFQNSALFGRLDAFLDRCNDVLNLSQSALQFHKLERVEIGGTKVRSVARSQGKFSPMPVTIWTCCVASSHEIPSPVLLCLEVLPHELLPPEVSPTGLVLTACFTT